MNEFFYQKKALIDARREMYFMPLADTTNMPKHYGKRIKVYHYIPLLDDRNVNDQGLDAAGAAIADGNLYGSSKDVGTITSKLPVVSETGGRVNRVGFTRITREGTISKLGFFTEYSQEAIDFDSDAQLMMHMNRELVNGAVQISEAALQLDLLNGAGVIVFAGDATSDATVNGESADPALVDYTDLFNLSLTLDDNRTPRETKIITGSRMIDTRTVRGGRIMYIGNELQHTVETMTDPFSDKAFIHAHQYGAATTLLNGEIGSVAQFRMIVVPEMQHWEGAGAVVGTNPGFRDDGTNYNIYPMLVVGDESFTTIGFQTSNKGGVKWQMIHKKPGKDIADRTNPYGEIGFHSIKWWYGTMILRPERLALIKTLAKV
jgi:N4-gp56 family major capsid protein